uniref:Uncharacterized protein n=1 Tax=viral metagenome TaxID=1070528 RepID=A0A2V0R9C5_9ZZZZ
MEAVASTYGDVFRLDDCSPYSDYSLWNFTIDEMSRYQNLSVFVSKLNVLKHNRCVYLDICTVHSEHDDIKEVFHCPCGMHRGLIICMNEDSLSITNNITTMIKRLLRSAIIRRDLPISSQQSCSFCHGTVNMNFEVSERVEEARKHVATELSKDDGVKLCYCDKESKCFCYLEQSVGFGTCIPMLYSTPGEHSVWCSKCEFPRFCTNPNSICKDNTDTILSSQNAGTDPVPFRHEANVVPLKMIPTLNRLLDDCLTLADNRKTIYLQGNGCEHASDEQCDCPSDEVMTTCVYANMCVTRSMAMHLRDALRNRGITLVVDCISCGKTQLCPEIEVNAFDVYEAMCLDTAEYSLNIEESDRVSLECNGQ